jgi:hypothetical protein
LIEVFPSGAFVSFEKKSFVSFDSVGCLDQMKVGREESEVRVRRGNRERERERERANRFAGSRKKTTFVHVGSERIFATSSADLFCMMRSRLLW